MSNFKHLKIDTKPSALDVLNAKIQSTNPLRFFGETTDNSSQYGATKVHIVINEKEKCLIVEDNGNGFSSDESFLSFHKPYAVPIEAGISKYGIGGKIFKTLADVRITFSISNDSYTSKKTCRFSLWDTKDQVSTENPFAISWPHKDKIPSEVLSVLDQYTAVLSSIQKLCSKNKTGTIVSLVEIDDARFGIFKTYSNMYAKVKRHMFERYHLLIHREQKEIVVNYINGKGAVQSSTVEGWNPMSHLDRNLNKRVRISRHRSAEINTWVTDQPGTRKITRGLWVYRNNILISIEAFLKRSGRNQHDVVEIDPTKRMYRLNTERQTLILHSDADEEYRVSETKDSVTIPQGVKCIIADQFDIAVKLVEQNRASKTKTAIEASKSVSMAVPSFSAKNIDQSWIKTDSGFQLVQDSIFHNKLKSMNKEQINTHMTILESMQDIYDDLQDASARSQFTKWMNLVAQKHHIKMSA